MIKKVFLGTCVLLVSTMALATEQEDAQALCVDATIIAAKSSGLKENSLAFACKSNSRSAEYWQCVIDKQKAGNNFNYSTAQCDKVDPQ